MKYTYDKDQFTYDLECEGCNHKKGNHITVCVKEFRTKDEKCPCGGCLVKVTCETGCPPRTSWIQRVMI